MVGVPRPSTTFSCSSAVLFPSACTLDTLLVNDTAAGAPPVSGRSTTERAAPRLLRWTSDSRPPQTAGASTSAAAPFPVTWMDRGRPSAGDPDAVGGKNIAELVADDDGDAADAAIAHHHPGNVQVHLQRGGWAGVDCQLAEGGGGAVGGGRGQLHPIRRFPDPTCQEG